MSMYIPQTLAGGRYSVGDLIGHGGMAEVHIGTDTRLGRTVAIKIMRSDLASDQIFLRRFHREALAVAKLNNPNIVAIYDSGDEEFSDEGGHTVRVPYIVMEYIKGQTLRDILKVNGALSEHDTAQVMIGVLSALEYSHREGIIHRDIKPGNIMISNEGIVKVMDFGIARALDDSQTTMTQSQGVVGTAQYLSPEQARGEQVDMRSDLYSAGCVLYEMLTGRPPFVGDSAVAIAYQHVSETATPPSAIVPGLPKEWDAIVAKAMAKNRANRYSTAGEFRDDIVRLMNGVEPLASNSVAPMVADKMQDTPPYSIPPVEQDYATGAYPTAAVQNGVGTATGTMASPYATAAGTGTGTAVKAKNGSKKKVVAIIAALVVVALAVAAFVVLHNNSQGTATEQVTVPTISAGTSRDRAKEQIEAAGLVFQYKEDTDSTEDAGTFTKQDPAGGTTVDKGSTVTVWFSAGPQSAKVPDVSGMTQSEAQSALESAGFKVGSIYTESSGSVSKDSVTRTDPASGESAKKGSTVDLYISNGMTVVPDGLVGASQSTAQGLLSKQGLQVVVEQESSDSVAQGLVTRTSPASGDSVEQGATVTIYVSTGPKTVSLPSVIGMTYDNAAATLKSMGLTAARSGSQSDAAVVSAMTVNGEEVEAGSQVSEGATVTLTMSGGSSSSDSSSSASPSASGSASPSASGSSSKSASN
ncbi:MAG: Stk1 family PASTA domain-containing Ser/Thr kinase [Bifidobacteriaceae bacterium]|nr:Stk1 family PASTA domain-containing Ser/Thr kinase [Bifidobacteriaceae bacterium]